MGVEQMIENDGWYLLSFRAGTDISSQIWGQYLNPAVIIPDITNITAYIIIPSTATSNPPANLLGLGGQYPSYLTDTDISFCFKAPTNDYLNIDNNNWANISINQTLLYNTAAWCLLGNQLTPIYPPGPPAPPGTGFIFLIGDGEWNAIINAVGSDVSGVPVIPDTMTIYINTGYSLTQTQVEVDYTNAATTAQISGFTMNTLLGLLDSAGITTYNIEITQWANIPFTTGGYNLSQNGGTLRWSGKISTTNAHGGLPLLLPGTSLANCFEGATSNDFGNINSWDVSAVTNMSSMFQNASFNRDIGDWDILNVTTISDMFTNSLMDNIYNINSSRTVAGWVDTKNSGVSGIPTTVFIATVPDWPGSLYDFSYVFLDNATFLLAGPPYNTAAPAAPYGDVSGWNVSRLTDMHNGFSGNTSFNEPISFWDTAQCTDMSGVFNGATIFNQDLSWNTAVVVNMSGMFNGASIFNSDISNWNTTNVLNMSSMFKGTDDFDEYLNWNTINVTNMDQMFRSTQSFNKELIWNTSNVISMVDMFRAAIAFDGDLNWDTNNVIDMNGMFLGASIFNKDLSFNTSNVTNMSNMFETALLFNRDISSWQVGNVITMTEMFQNAAEFNQDLGNWNISGLTTATNMFTGSAMATTYNINSSRTIAGWVDTKNSGVSGVPTTVLTAGGYPYDLYDFSYVFLDNATFLLAGPPYNTASPAAPYGDVSGWNVSRLTDMHNGFSGNTSFNEPISFWDTAQCTDMSGVFNGATIFNQDLSWNTSNVVNMSSMFNGASIFNSDISGWDVENVITMIDMFNSASDFDVDISGWDVGNVTNMTQMFKNAGLFNKDLNWNTSSVIEMEGMFHTASNFNGNITTWNTSSVANMSSMFYYAVDFDQNINNWNTISVTNMSSMFEGASIFDKDLSWNTINVENMSNMFYGASNFNGNISDWVVSSVTNMDSMFREATNFNKDLNWYTLSVINMSSMFKSSAFNKDIGDWNISVLTTANNMLDDSSMSNINYSNLLIGWAAQSPYIQNSVHLGAESLYYNSNAQLARLKLTSIYLWVITDEGQNNIIVIPSIIAALTNWSHMWQNGIGNSYVPQELAYIDISGIVLDALSDFSLWDPSMVINTSYMFSSAQDYIGLGLTNWDIGNITNMNNMFNNSGFNQDISAWNISSLTTAANMLNNCNMSTINYSNLLIGWEAQTHNSGVPLGAVGIYYNDTAILARAALVSDGWIIYDAGNGTIIIFPASIAELIDWSHMWENGIGNSNIPQNPDYIDISGIVLDTLSDFNLWDPSMVINMESMFEGASDFSGNGLTNWNISNVTNMQTLFSGATAFNEDLSAWNTINVTNMKGTFHYADVFNQDISGWNTSNVTDMNQMFNANGSNFNQNIGSWNTANVTDMASMLNGATSFNQPIGNWNTSKVTLMDHMFRVATSFNQDLSGWDTSKVTDMQVMFKNATVFNGNITNWDTSKVTNMQSMFWYAHIFNQDISGWNTGLVTNMENMFNEVTVFNQDISGWNTINVTNMTAMFNNATAFNQDLGAWNISNVTAMYEMFTNSAMATTYNTNSSRTVAGWVDSENSGVSGVPATVLSGIADWPGGLYDFSYVFLDNATFLLAGGTNYPVSITTYGDVSGWNVSRLTNMSSGFKSNTTFNEDLTLWDTANVTNMSSMFNGASDFNKNLSFNTSSVLDMQEMFSGASDFNSDISFTNTSSVIYMIYMFNGASTFNKNISFNTSSVINMGNMFQSTSLFNSDISFSDTSLVTNMGYMFFGASAFNKDISFNTSSVINMNNMFNSASDFNKDISFNTNSVINMERMFNSASDFNSDISFSDTSLVTNMKEMFKGATNFNKDIGDWNISSLTNATDMFTSSPMATTYNTNSSRTVAGWVDSENSGASGVPATVLSGISGWPGGLYTFSYVFLDNTTFLLAGGTNYPGSITTYGDVSDWNVSRLTDMNEGFKDNTTFNEDLSLWDTANATDMGSMFVGATAFNQDISAWNTANVTDMNSMFAGTAFNKDISAWNTANVTLMTAMFASATIFNQDISGWNTINVTNMTAMFQNATAFNQDLGAWNISNVNAMYVMFTSSPMATTYNTNSSRTVAGWVDSENSGVSGVPATVLSGISGWPGGLYTFSYVFLDNTTFLLAGGTNYPGSITIYGNVSDWNVSRLTDMDEGFKSNTTFNEDLTLWDTANVTNMSYMFNGATAFNQDISAWNISSLTNATDMLTSSGMSTTNYSNLLIGWAANPIIQNNVTFGAGTIKYNIDASAARLDLSNNYLWTITDGGQEVSLAFPASIAALTDWSQMFQDGVGNKVAQDPLYVDISGIVLTANSGFKLWDPSMVTNITDMFQDCSLNISFSISEWDVGNVINMNSLFYGNAPMLFNEDLSDWNTINVTSMNGMFNKCTEFNQDLGNWNVSNVTSFFQIFRECDLFEGIGLEKWDVAGATASLAMERMFHECNNFNQDLSGWDVRNCPNFYYMFQGCRDFTGNGLDKWHPQSATGSNGIEGMFLACDNFNQDLSGWAEDISACTSMQSMFHACLIYPGTGLQYWNTTNVTTMSYMFNGATAFNQDISAWDISGLTNATDMLTSSGMSTTNYSNLLIGWAANPIIQNNVTFGAGTIKYNIDASAARLDLSNNYLWTITDGGPE